MIRRGIYSVFVIIGLVIVVFFVTRLLGDPIRLMLPPQASDQQIETVQNQFGLNDPLLTQFGRYLQGAVRGDFGDSIWMRQPALPIVLERLPRTLLLATITIAIALPLAVAMGVISAVKPRSFIDRIVTVVSLGGLSVADFWLGLMAILIFAVELGWLPTSGYGGLSGWQFAVLPALTLAVRPIGRISQIQRSSMLDELSQGYVATARAKGLSERVVIVMHALRNAAIPTVTLAGTELSSLLNGAIVIETIFGWPGIGSLLIQAIERRDMPLVVASTVVIATMIIVLNLLIDLLYAALDPRIRY